MVSFEGSSFICIAPGEISGQSPKPNGNNARWEIVARGYKPRAYKHIDTAARTFGTSAAVGMVTPAWDFPAGSDIRLAINIPMRNDAGDETWGGGYTELQYSLY